MTAVFREGELVKLAALLETAEELARQSEDTAAQIRLATRELNEAIKRADALNRPVIPPKEKLRNEGRPTANARGPKRLLEILNEHYPSRLTVPALEGLAEFAASTVRTYLPCLKESGYVVALEDGLLITPHGKAYLEAEQPLSFARP